MPKDPLRRLRRCIESSKIREQWARRILLRAKMLQRRLANEVDWIQLKLRKIQGKAQRQGKSPTLREAESSETVVHSPSLKPACKGPKSSQKGGSKGSQGVLLRSLTQDESSNKAETLKTEEVAASCVHRNVEASKTAQALSPRARGHSQSVPRITIQPATDATGIISPLPTPSGTRVPSLSGEEIRGSTMSRRNSMTQNPFSPATGMTSGFFLDTTKPTPSQPTRSVDELSSLLQFPEYGHDTNGTGGANPPAERVSRKKRRSHVLRKGRYLVFRSPVLQAMLGRDSRPSKTRIGAAGAQDAPEGLPSTDTEYNV